MGQTYVLEMENITKTFPGVKALDNVSLKVRPGTVHALMGENGAGKSTLMKCLFGIYTPDSGNIKLDGKNIQFKTAREALDTGVSMIHQELNPVPHRNVMENIWLGRNPLIDLKIIKPINHKKMFEDTKKLLEDLNMDIDPKILMSELSVSKMQSVEIAKAVSFNSKVIIMDEPTSSLTENEVAHLFKIINDLRAKGVAIIYISHKMEEILTISDEVTIMRDGTYIGTWAAKELTTDIIISKMVGRDLSNRFPHKDYSPGKEKILEVDNLTSTNHRSFKKVSFELYKGEILGIGGLVGAQRTELVEAIFGLRGIASGTIKIKGQVVENKHASDAMNNGIALVTEDRRLTGIFGVLSIEENALIASLDKFVDFGFVLNNAKKGKVAREHVERLKTKTPSMKQQIQHLSGGNQQKVILARWLIREPEILILDEPTRGIDVGAKFEIYTIMTELAKQGKAVIMISSEMPELMGMSDRIMVMCDGKLTAIIEGDEVTQENIMKYATQFD